MVLSHSNCSFVFVIIQKYELQSLANVVPDSLYLPSFEVITYYKISSYISFINWFDCTYVVKVL